MVIIPHEVALVAGPEIRIWVILGKYPCKTQPASNSAANSDLSFLAYRDVNGIIHLTYAGRCLPLIQLSRSRRR